MLHRLAGRAAHVVRLAGFLASLAPGVAVECARDAFRHCHR